MNHELGALSRTCVALLYCAAVLCTILQQYKIRSTTEGAITNRLLCIYYKVWGVWRLSRLY